MLAPYLDRPGTSGEPLFAPAALDLLVARLDAADFDVHVHAIGDRAVRIALDAFAAARGKVPASRARRHQIAHLELVSAADVPRFRALGVVANFQPLWAFADSYIRDLTWPALGPERSRRLYPIADLARSGAVLAFGSDWSVSSSNPLEGIQVAVTRQSVDPADRSEPMLPEQAIGLPEALAAYTIGAAYANGLESETGSIEVGKAADLVVLEDDLFRRRPDQIGAARVLLTLLEGQPVYRDPSLAW
jgi:predicted amidohydrolase YtcJ